MFVFADIQLVLVKLALPVDLCTATEAEVRHPGWLLRLHTKTPSWLDGSGYFNAPWILIAEIEKTISSFSISAISVFHYGTGFKTGEALCCFFFTALSEPF
jgi:hypothetical protein